MRQKRVQLLAGALVILVLILVAAARLGSRGRRQADETADVEAGVSYLRSLEAEDPEQVTAILKAIHQEELEQQREARLRELESGAVSVWSLFEDYVLLGDSRAVGFYFYDFLPEERVLAEGGGTIRQLREHIPEIKALDPATVFLCYGLNDVSIGYWPTPEEYAAEYAEVIGELQAELPEAQIYISSALPARDAALELEPLWANIPLYNAAVKAMCDGIEGCWYVDNDGIAEEYADLWDIDGIHVQQTFYPHWATNLMMAVYSSGLDWDGEDEY